MVLRAPLASTVPIGRAAVAERVAEPVAATVVAGYPPVISPRSAPAPGRARRLSRRLAIGIAAVVVLLLLLGLCQAVLGATTLAVNPNRVAPGGTVTVTATRVPANQTGEIQLWSVVHTYPFSASGKGDVSLDMTVPRDIALGDHVVKICWKNACHAQTGLRVVSGVAAASPTAVANTSPGATPTAGSTPRSSPNPTAGATPTSGSTPHPTSTPTSVPKPTPSPTPTQNPCSGNSSAAALTPANQSVVLGGSASFTGSNFTPNSSVSLSYYAPQSAAAPTKTWSVKATCAGGFTTSVTTNGGVVRTDKVVACDVAKGCVTAKINVLL